MSRLRALLGRPVDGASLALFRILFGALMVIAASRFFWHGWIDADYRAAKVFFSYPGLTFIRPWPWPGMKIHYAVMGLAALAVALGVCYRFAIVLFCATFSYAHLCDKSNYLNHYYLISLLSLLMIFLPLDGQFALRGRRQAHVPAWMLYLLRFQVGVVYLFGAIGKLGADWLWRGEPLRIWLRADGELPILRHLVGWPPLPQLFSWGGLLFDLSVVPFLLYRPTRKYAYFAAILFHVATAALFHIGMFPWVMLVGATLFFDPAWPRRFISRGAGTPAARPPSRLVVTLLALYALIQMAIPLRSFLYPGNTLWTEEGFRFAWKVMLIEKSGALEFTVVQPNGTSTRVTPRDYLTPFQMRMVSTQPDMILQFAHVVADDYARRGLGPVRVYADAQVSWNGRRRAPLIDSQIDLAQQTDGWQHKRWILPAPTGAPIF